MFVFSFRCTNSSGPRRSEAFEHVSQTVTLSREDGEVPRTGDRSHNSSSHDLQSLLEVSLFFRDENAAWRGEP